jgi:hypothetical protein
MADRRTGRRAGVIVPAVPRGPIHSALVALAVAVVVVGCGPSNGGAVEAGDHAKAVCASQLRWKQGVTSDSARLSRQLRARSADVATVKANYTAFFHGAVGRTDALLEGIEKSGAPKVDNGVDHARDLRAALAETRTGLADARVRLAALPIGDLRFYAAGSAHIRDELGQAFLGVGAALDRLGRRYPDKALNTAFERQPECKRLT